MDEKRERNDGDIFVIAWGQATCWARPAEDDYANGSNM